MMDNNNMLPIEVQEELERLQQIQMSNPPSSEAWQAASRRIHELQPEAKDAHGR